MSPENVQRLTVAVLWRRATTIYEKAPAQRDFVDVECSVISIMSTGLTEDEAVTRYVNESY